MGTRNTPPAFPTARISRPSFCRWLKRKALAELRQRNDVRWTFISPAADFRPDGARTGKYILGGEELTLNSRRESVVSYADYAIAMVDEAENGNHIQQRISVVAD